MAKSQSRLPTQAFQLMITLLDSQPPIWRRVLMIDISTLYQLHQVIQISMGWTNSHLHLFDIDSQLYSLPEFELDEWNEPVSNEKRTRLNTFDWKPKKKFHYEYDFGDCWRHEVVLEKLLPIEEGIRYPKCIGGARACPPEDVYRPGTSVTEVRRHG